MPIGLSNRQYNSRQTCPASNIQPLASPQVLEHRKAIKQVMTHHLMRIADRSQVIDLVPLVEQCQIIQQFPLHLRSSHNPELRYANTQFLGQIHADFWDGVITRKPRFKWTSSKEIAAGVMPEMRAACPIVSGLCRLSFCCTSMESPRTWE